MADLKVLGGLELLGWAQHRNIFPRKADIGDRIEELIPSSTTLCVLHLRFPGGKPFSVTIDEATFVQVVLPVLDAMSQAAMLEASKLGGLPQG